MNKLDRDHSSGKAKENGSLYFKDENGRMTAELYFQISEFGFEPMDDPNRIHEYNISLSIKRPKIKDITIKGSTLVNEKFTGDKQSFMNFVKETDWGSISSKYPLLCKKLSQYVK